MGYGLGVHGAPPQLVAKMRSVLRSAWQAPGASATSSAWITSCLQGNIYSDQQIQAWVMPIYQWVLLARDKVISRAVLQRAWQVQIQKVHRYDRPWAMVLGTTGAMLMSIEALGWTTSSAFCFKTDGGQ
eukprot:830854-Pyramimonas_sp.AAC.1